MPSEAAALCVEECGEGYGVLRKEVFGKAGFSDEVSATRHLRNLIERGEGVVVEGVLEDGTDGEVCEFGKIDDADLAGDLWALLLGPDSAKGHDV